MAKTLFERLQNASSEEDVKDIYIDVLGLKRTRKNLIDIQTKEIWFETKKGAQTSVYEMFTQLLCYVFTAHKKRRGSASVSLCDGLCQGGNYGNR